MKNLENYGVQELDANEIKGTDGGFLGALALAALAWFAIDTITNPVASGQAFVDGINAGYNYNQ